MDIADAAVGKVILTATSAVFVALVLWVNSYPFIDKELAIFSSVPDPQWFLAGSALFGLVFVGGLMAFTLYHIHPYLRTDGDRRTNT